MKAKVLMLALMGSCALSFGAQAQETTQKSGHKTIFNRDKGCDHWFIDVQGGVGMLPFGEANNAAALMDRIYPVPTIAVGKWHEPWFATRLQLTAWNMKGFENAVAPATAPVAYNNLFGTLQYEFLFDVVNYFAKYNPKRVFHFVPFVGVGAAYKYHTTGANGVVSELHTKHDPSFSANAGVLLKFRLGRRVDLNIEAQMLASKMNLAGSRVENNGADLMAFATAGLGFNLGKPEWTEIVPMDWGLVNDLNGQINNLRAENAELSKRPVSCPECPEVAPETVAKTAVRNVVYFRISSAKVDQNQYINIYNTAQYAKNNNSKIYLVGYADEKTGTSEFNMSLSEKRAKAVAKLLIEKYGISEDMIVIDYKGSTEQLYEVNEWNRIVVMTAAE